MPLAPALRGQNLIRAESDVLLIGDNDEIEDIHSILLMTLSPYFQTVLESDSTLYINKPNNTKTASQDVRNNLDNAHSKGTSGNNYNRNMNSASKAKAVRILGADSQMLKLIKEYAYEGKITGLSEDNIEKVHKVADMYNIMGILNECQLFIRNTNTQEH